MLKRTLSLVLLVGLPTLMLAQRGGGGGGGSRVQRGDKEADWNSMNSTQIRLSNKDVENMSPLKLLLDKHKDLKLTDDQTNKIKQRDDQLKESTKPGFAALDSLRRAAAIAGRSPDEGDVARLSETRRGFTQIVSGIRTQYDAAFTEILALLDESQQATAKDLVQHQKADADDTIKDKLSGGRP